MIDFSVTGFVVEVRSTTNPEMWLSTVVTLGGMSVTFSTTTTQANILREFVSGPSDVALQFSLFYGRKLMRVLDPDENIVAETTETNPPLGY